MTMMPHQHEARPASTRYSYPSPLQPIHHLRVHCVPPHNHSPNRETALPLLCLPSINHSISFSTCRESLKQLAAARHDTVPRFTHNSSSDQRIKSHHVNPPSGQHIKSYLANPPSGQHTKPQPAKQAQHKSSELYQVIFVYSPSAKR